MRDPSAASGADPKETGFGPTAHEKLAQLKAYINDKKNLAVAFSGGVDSTFLLRVAKEVLGDRVIAVTAKADFFPAKETAQTSVICADLQVSQYFVSPDLLGSRAFTENPPDRCYFCKKQLFTEIRKTAAALGIDQIAEGSNLDDLRDYRPGLRAIRELGILSPLREAALTKQEIRLLSRELGLASWQKPSFACLASRFPYGEPVTAEKLRMVEQAENLLSVLGFRQYRVRVHGTMARLEILPEQMDLILQPPVREGIVSALTDFGFSYVSLDLKGYRTGSMNEVLQKA